MEEAMESSRLFAVFPYVSVALLVVGTLVRYVLASRQPSMIREEIADAKIVYGGRLFWTSVFLLLAGHVAGLLFPSGILSWNSSTGGLYLLEGLGFILGLAGVITGARLVWRHLGHSSRSRLIESFDTIFLAIVFVALLSGVLIAVFYRWGSSWAAMTLAPYLASILRGQPALLYVREMPFLVQLHVLAAFAAIAVLPLTRLATFLVAAMQMGVVLMGWPFRIAASAFAGWSRKHDPGAWFWPEED
jgi:nitrate reductase gamma subunit